MIVDFGMRAHDGFVGEEQKAPRTRRNENETLYFDFNVVGGCFDGRSDACYQPGTGCPGFQNRSGDYWKGPKAFEEDFEEHQDCSGGFEEDCGHAGTGEVVVRSTAPSGRGSSGRSEGVLLNNQAAEKGSLFPRSDYPTRATSSMWTGGL